MKKIIVNDKIKQAIDEKEGFLKRKFIQIFTTTTNDETLLMHRLEKVSLIITDMEAPGTSCETICDAIRSAPDLCKVSIIIVHSGSPEDVERISRCKGNVFIARPLDIPSLVNSAFAMLNIRKRMAYRVPVGIRVNGKYNEIPFIGYSENISSTGMLFDTEIELSVGDIADCSFFVPESVHVTTKIEIVRIADKENEYDINQYGAKFITLNDETKSAIDSFVEKNL